MSLTAPTRATLIRPSSGSSTSKGSREITPAAGQKDFQKALSEGIKKVDEAVKGFEQDTRTFAQGGAISIQELMVKSDQADIALRLMNTVKNKVIDAYQEVMRLQV